MFREKNDISNLASHLLRLGTAKRAANDLDAAYAYFEESLKFARECGRVNVIAGAIHNLAAIDKEREQRASATAYARQARDLFRRLGKKQEQAEAEALLATLEEESRLG